MLYQPTDALLDEYKNAYLGFEFMDAVKCRILLMVLDDAVDNLPHLIRALYSPAEVFYNLAETVEILYNLLNDSF